METKKVKDLSDDELIQELYGVEEKLKAEYSILGTYKTYKKELVEEMEIRFIKRYTSDRKEEV
jgi:hypothetical protein